MNKVMEKSPVKSRETPSPVSGGWPSFEGLRNEIDRLFRSYGSDMWQMPRLEKGPLPWTMMERGIPPVDVTKTGTGYEVKVDLPGLGEEDVEVTYSDGLLTISGDKTVESEDDRGGVLVSERRRGSFRRMLRVPDTVDPDKIEGHVDKGVLTVTMPLLPDVKTSERKIDISST